MGVVEEFVGRYRREQDFYEHSARLAAQTLETRVQEEGIRAIVTYRAKQLGKLEPKVRDRSVRKNYTSVEEVYADIVDLAGARVALYFPGQREVVGRLIEEIFVVLEKKEFPDEASTPRYTKRFAGYGATHYRVRLREALLPEPHKKYADARIEIQVASVLMHAWSEVEHDLVYKPLQGELSIDEYSVLDELNGLVMAGELALERLQRAGEARVASAGRPFSNHYELATHLLREGARGLPPDLANAALGRVDLLFELLFRLKMAKADDLRPFLDRLHQDFERRPMAEQIIDQLLSQDESRYKTFEEVKAGGASPGLIGLTQAPETLPREFNEALGLFMGAWIAVERYVREHAPASMRDSPQLPTFRMVDRLIDLGPTGRQEFERIRRLRNNLVHGVETPAIPDLVNATEFLTKLLNSLNGTA